MQKQPMIWSSIYHEEPEGGFVEELSCRWPKAARTVFYRFFGWERGSWKKLVPAQFPETRLDFGLLATALRLSTLD